MPVNNITYESPENKRWAEQGVEAKLRELENTIRDLASRVRVLEERLK